jgi:hypothetical protein
LKFLYTLSKSTQVSNLTKIRPVEGEFFYAKGKSDRQTNIMKPILASCNYVNATKSGCNLKNATVGRNYILHQANIKLLETAVKQRGVGNTILEHSMQ